jgi:hypothetical protein
VRFGQGVFVVLVPLYDGIVVRRTGEAARRHCSVRFGQETTMRRGTTSENRARRRANMRATGKQRNSTLWLYRSVARGIQRAAAQPAIEGKSLMRRTLMVSMVEVLPMEE